MIDLGLDGVALADKWNKPAIGRGLGLEHNSGIF
jgi:hypothetical protein